MFAGFKKAFVLLAIFCFFGALVFVYSFSFRLKAAELGPTFLFLERMKISEATEMVFLFTPSTDFNSLGDPRVLRLVFSGDSGDWCQVDETELVVTGIAFSNIDLDEWTIDSALPGTLSASCKQNVGGDYIEVIGLGDLVAGNAYGLEIASNVNFTTGPNVGNNIVSAQVTEGSKTETISFGITLLTDDQVVVTASVDPADTITCSLSTNAVSLGNLYRGGAYVTSLNDLVLETQGSSGFYWAVYGTGNGASGDAGLWKSAAPTYLISSAGVGGLVNLLTGEGFGMVLTTSGGTVRPNYVATNPGVFGSIGRSFENANLILTSTTPVGDVSSSVTLGARASATAEEGSYQEILTYICGAYVGEGELP
jgi:hypothetical protein